MTSIRLSTIAASGLLVLAILAGCMGQESDGTGQVNFFVKDAPADEFESIFVTFSKVEVHQAQAGENETGDEDDSDANETEDADNETDEDGSKWIVIVNETHTVDLKAFQGDAKAFLGSENISAGKYTQIRIHVDEAWGENGGNRTNFTVPSGTLKIRKPWTIGDGDVISLVVDFDLAKSLVMAGSDYKLNPKMTLAVEEEGARED